MAGTGVKQASQGSRTLKQALLGFDKPEESADKRFQAITRLVIDQLALLIEQFA